MVWNQKYLACKYKLNLYGMESKMIANNRNQNWNRLKTNSNWSKRNELKSTLNLNLKWNRLKSKSKKLSKRIDINSNWKSKLATTADF